MVRNLAKYGAKGTAVIARAVFVHASETELKALVDVGMNIDEETTRSSMWTQRDHPTTALGLALTRGYEDEMRVLLRLGANPTYRMSNGTPVLHKLGPGTTYEAYRLLAFVEPMTTENGETVAHAAVRCQVKCERLLEALMDPLPARLDGRTPMHICAETGNWETASFIFDLYVTRHSSYNLCHARDQYGWAPLATALQQPANSYPFFDGFRANGADPFATDADGRSLLHLAIRDEREIAVEWLLDCGARDIGDIRSISNVRIVQMLTDHGVVRERSV